MSIFSYNPLFHITVFFPINIFIIKKFAIHVHRLRIENGFRKTSTIKNKEKSLFAINSVITEPILILFSPIDREFNIVVTKLYWIWVI